MLKLSLLNLFFITSSKAIAISSDCSKGNSVFNLDAIRLDPDIPRRNENWTLYLDYTVPDSLTVTSGTAVYSLTYNFIPISPNIDDLCKDTSCPITPGPHSQASTSKFPDLTGNLLIKTQWFDDAKKELLCYSFNLKV